MIRSPPWTRGSWRRWTGVTWMASGGYTNEGHAAARRGKGRTTSRGAAPVFIARVVGDVVATHRHRNLGGHKLLLIRRLSLSGVEEGGEVIALDVIGVGVGERVLVVQEGNAARALFKSRTIPAQAVVVGVIDHVETESGTILEAAE